MITKKVSIKNIVNVCLIPHRQEYQILFKNNYFFLYSFALFGAIIFDNILENVIHIVWLDLPTCIIGLEVNGFSSVIVDHIFIVF